MYLDNSFLGEVENMEEANGFAVPVQNVQEHPVGVTDLQAQASQAQCHQCFCTLKHPVRNCTHTSLHLALRMATMPPVPNDIRITTLNLQTNSRETRPRPGIICADVSISLE